MRSQYLLQSSNILPFFHSSACCLGDTVINPQLDARHSVDSISLVENRGPPFNPAGSHSTKAFQRRLLVVRIRGQNKCNKRVKARLTDYLYQLHLSLRHSCPFGLTSVSSANQHNKTLIDSVTTLVRQSDFILLQFHFQIAFSSAKTSHEALDQSLVVLQRTQHTGITPDNRSSLWSIEDPKCFWKAEDLRMIGVRKS